MALGASSILIMLSQPGVQRFQAFTTELSSPEPVYVTDDKDNATHNIPGPSTQAGNNSEEAQASEGVKEAQAEAQEHQCTPIPLTFHDNILLDNTTNDLQNMTEKQAEWNRWHLNMNHAQIQDSRR